MLKRALDSYLDVRRAVGFELKIDERLLRSFVRFAADRKDSHVKQQTRNLSTSVRHVRATFTEHPRA